MEQREQGKATGLTAYITDLKMITLFIKQSLQELLDEIRETFGEKTTTTNFLKKRLGNADLIIFEDLGNEFLTDWVKEKLYFIFDFIDKTDKSIIINTNLNDSQIEGFFKILGSSKLLSRVRSKTKYYKFDWEDRRIGKYKKNLINILGGIMRVKKIETIKLEKEDKKLLQQIEREYIYSSKFGGNK